jgi:hypothetical protein
MCAYFRLNRRSGRNRLGGAAASLLAFMRSQRIIERKSIRNTNNPLASHEATRLADVFGNALARLVGALLHEPNDATLA